MNTDQHILVITSGKTTFVLYFHGFTDSIIDRRATELTGSPNTHVDLSPRSLLLLQAQRCHLHRLPGGLEPLRCGVHVGCFWTR